MKYIKRFENIVNNHLNSILLIDCSGSFQGDLKRVLKTVNLYLTARFTVILCTSGENVMLEDVNLQELNSKIQSYNLYSFGEDVQKAIDYIKYKNVEGNILIITDGYIKLDLSIKNNVTILSSDTKPTLINDDNCQIFYKDLESLDQFYPPRDDSYEEYELKAVSNKYNI